MWVSAIRLEITAKPDAADAAQKKWKGASVGLSAKLLTADGRKETKVGFYHAEADHKTERYSNGTTILGVTDRWHISTDYEHQQAVWLLDMPIEAKAGDAL